MTEDPCGEARERLREMIMEKISRLLDWNIELSTEWNLLFREGDPAQIDISRTVETTRAEVRELQAEWKRVGNLACDEVHNRATRYAEEGLEETARGNEGLRPGQFTPGALKRSLDALRTMFQSDVDHIVHGPADTIQSVVDYYTNAVFRAHVNALDDMDSAAVSEFESEASAKIMEMIMEVGHQNAYFAYGDDEFACAQTAFEQMRASGADAGIEQETGMSWTPGEPTIVETHTAAYPNDPISAAYRRCMAEVEGRREVLTAEIEKREQALATLQAAFISMASARSLAES